MMLSSSAPWRNPVVLAIAGFLGFMFATAGTVLWPDGVLWSGRILCSAPYHLSHASTAYSYGTHTGSIISFSCVDGFGDSSGSVGFFPILGLQWLIGTTVSYVVLVLAVLVNDASGRGRTGGSRRRLSLFGGRWQPAKATIVAARALSNWSRNAGGAAGSNWTPWEYVADVKPRGHKPFRATFHEPLMHGYYGHPKAGDVVNVLYRARSGEVKLGDEYKIDAAARRTVRSDGFRAAAAAAPGTPAA